MTLGEFGKRGAIIGRGEERAVATWIVLGSVLTEIHVWTECTLIVGPRAAEIFGDVRAVAVVSRSCRVDAEIETRAELASSGSESTDVRGVSKLVTGAIRNFGSIDTHVQSRTKMTLSVQ